MMNRFADHYSHGRLVAALLCVLVIALPASGQEPAEGLEPAAGQEPVVGYEPAQVPDVGQDDQEGSGDPKQKIGRMLADAKPYEESEFLPQVEDGRFVLPKLEPISTSTDEIGNGRIPDDFRKDQMSPTIVLPEDSAGRGMQWSWTVSNWVASNNFSHPRYFEDRMLERHGHERYPLMTPICGGARFFTTIPMLPYLMTVRPPCECESTMGYYRSGSCAPGLWQRPPLERNAVLVESAVVSGLIIAFP